MFLILLYLIALELDLVEILFPTRSCLPEDHVVKRVMTKAIPGKRKRGRPKTRWKDVCKRDMQTLGLREGDEGDRAYWKEMINNHSGDPR